MDMDHIKMVMNANLMIIVGLCVLLGIVIFNMLFDQRQRKLFLCAIAGNLFVIICVITDFFCMSLGGIMEAVYLRRFTSFVNFASSPLVPLLLAAVFSKRRRPIIYYLPAAVNVVICLVSTTYPLVFSISDDNKYGRGILFFLPIATALFYTVLLLLEPMARHRRAQQQERLFLSLVIFLLTCSMALEIILKMSFLLWNMAGLSLIMYYLLLNVHYFTLDSLTGCYNRMAYRWTLSAIEGKKGYMITAMDINGLKAINDTMGHAEGDRLLTHFVILLSEYTNVSSDLYRIGGDEFVLLTRREKVGKYHVGMNKVLAEAKKEGISFAYGEADYMPPQLIADVAERADERMYEMKKKMKAEAVKNMPGQ